MSLAVYEPVFLMPPISWAQASGKDVKLVPEKRAIYDISWDNDGTDSAGTVKLHKCLVDAYIWNSKAGVFDYDPKLTAQATRSYCHELANQVH